MPDNIPIDPSIDMPERLRRGLLRIAREADARGDALPGENELARVLGANRPQVRRELAELEHQGIVRRHQGAATTVDPVALRMSVRLEEQVEHTALLRRLGYEPTVDLLESGTGEIPSRIHRNLSAGVPASGIHAVKRWNADGRPAMLAENYLSVPAEHSGTVDAAGSIFDVAEAVWGEPLLWEVATPGVEALSEESADRLQLEPGSPCLTLEIIGVTRSGLRVFHSFERHHPLIVRYSLVRTIPAPWR
ncbi:hypothetical protein GCM10022381_32120 [Leifsonia kafniensis]|uniref:HTH gntR-type domain-containing protein n=1 Tax=Leifsonia kafniensis TaxID=475957 RepID=A0ABP7KTL6_9MICO